MSSVLVISTSLRAKSNSDILTESLIKGAQDAGHEVEHISMKGKELKFCIGCLVTPIYYYEMSGQMKTLLDRLNPLYPSDYRFRKVYMLMTATEDEDYVPEKAISGLQGWVDCFEKAELAGSLFCGGISDPDEASGKKEEQDEAYEFGKSLK